MYHPVGSVKMGSVLDHELKVKGIRGLRVVDGSVIPEHVTANPNAPIIMIAEKISDVIKLLYEKNENYQNYLHDEL